MLVSTKLMDSASLGNVHFSMGSQASSKSGPRLSSIQNGLAGSTNPSLERWVLDSRCFSMIGVRKRGGPIIRFCGV